MLVSDLLKSIRGRLRQRGKTSSFTDEAIIDYMNEVLLEICDTLEFTRKVVNITPDSNKRVYLPADCLRLEFVGRNGVEISPLTPKETALLNNDINNSLGGWYGYLFTNGYLQLGSTDAVTLHYIAKLPDIENANQDLPFRQDYRMPIVYGVTALCCVELGINDKAAYWNSEYQRELVNRRETIRGNAFKTRKYPSLSPVEA